MNPHRLRAYIYLITVAVIWGLAAPVIKFTLGGIDPLPFLAYRFTIASIFSLAFFLVKIARGKKFKYLRANLGLATVYGLLAIPIALGVLFVGLDKSTVLDLALIGVVGPMIVSLGGAFFFRDHITKREKIGIAIVVFGVALNSISPIFGTDIKFKLAGNLLLLIYLLADSASILIAKRLVQVKIKSANLTNLAFLIGAATLIPITTVVYGFDNLIKMITTLPFQYHLGVWYMALFSGSLAYFLFVRAQRSIEVSEATLFNYLQPIFSVPLAIFWLGEKISTSFILGAVLITIGLIFAEYKKSNSKLITNSLKPQLKT